MVIGNSKNLRVFNFVILLKFMLAKYACFTVLLVLLLRTNMIKVCHKIVRLQEQFTIKRTRSESSTIQRNEQSRAD